LVLFSFTFFWSGFTGLSVTIGAIATLFVLMQITGRKSWAQLLGEPELLPASAVCATPYRCAKAGPPDESPALSSL
jgi:hypothetical protein